MIHSFKFQLKIQHDQTHGKNHTVCINDSSSNIINERSFADLVSQIFTTCGKNVTEVMVPATNPSISIDAMYFKLKFK